MRKLLIIGLLFLSISLQGQIRSGVVAASGGGASPSSTLNTDIIAFWPADETSGTTLNDAVGSEDFTTNGTTWSGGLVFDAATDDATRAHDDDLSNLGSAFSIAFWVNLSSLPSTNGQNYSFWAQNHNADPWRVIRVSSSQFNDYLYFFLQTANGGVNCSTSTAFSAGVNYCVVVTYDGSVMHIYRNGTEISDDAAQTGNTVNGLAATYIGSLEGSSEGIRGTMRYIGLWGKALSQDEVTEYYNSGTPIGYPF